MTATCGIFISLLSLLELFSLQVKLSCIRHKQVKSFQCGTTVFHSFWHYLFIEESTTFSTLKALKGRGVKVDLGFPDEMWDAPDAEVHRLKMQVPVTLFTA